MIPQTSEIMLTEFYTSIDTGLSLYTHYKNYLTKQSASGDIGALLENHNAEIKKHMDQIPAKLKPVFKENVRIVCGSLEKGLKKISDEVHQASRNVRNDIALLNSKIDNLSSEINQLSAITSWGFSKLIIANNISNSLLTDITKLLKIPDIQKERHYHIEEGLKYLKNGLLEEGIDSNFYDDSFNSFIKAIEIEPKDYFSHFQLGILRLYAETHLNPTDAIKHFVLASKYSMAEHNVGGTLTSVSLTSSFFSEEPTSTSTYKLIATQSNFYAARAAFLDKDYGQAISFAHKALQLIPEFHRAEYELAKYLMFDGSNAKAINLLEKLILKDRYISFKLANDPDLMAFQEVSILLNKLNEAEQIKLTNYLSEIRRIMTDHPESQVKGKLEEWKVSENTDYLEARRLNDLIEAKHSWEEKKASVFIGIKGKWTYTVTETTKNYTIIKFAAIEKEFYDHLPNVKNEAKENERIRIRNNVIISTSIFIAIVVLLKMCGAF